MYLIANNSLQKNAHKHNILGKQVEISDTDLIITHTIRQKKLLPLPLHFYADGHNINDLKVCILKGNFKDSKHRKLTQLQFFIHFETNKFCFNKDTSSLSKYDTFKHYGQICPTLISSFSRRYYFQYPQLSPLVVTLSPTELLSPI